MQLQHILLLVSLTSLSSAAETVLGVAIFHRHGDRTPKATPPANLTDLGYSEVYDSGTYYRQRYVSSTASHKIQGINADIVKLSQLAVSAPVDNVLQNSAQGFLQGLYPGVGPKLGQETLANKTIIGAPLNGYQLIPVQVAASGAGSENSAWLQGSSNCANAIVSSDNYFSSAEYKSLLNSTTDFYKNLTPTVNGILGANDMTFKNAYSIFDILNVASIHNATIPSSSLLTPSTLTQIRTLADTHEYALAANTSDPIRAISGAVLAAEILQALNATLATPQKAPKLTIQFGAYASFLSFFSLAALPAVEPDFYGIPDYASAMIFELFTTATPPTGSAAIDTKDVQVRFLFHNGTTSNDYDPVAYPLFGNKGAAPEIAWTDFAAGMSKFAVGDQKDWCQACGNSTSVCASTAPPPAAQDKSGGGSGGVSKPVAGVIGAMVTLAVILGLEALVLLMAGLRVVKKRKGEPVNANGGSSGSEDGVKA
ncbi:uncharacterized protein KY384_000117 [Bacidia gigantensis]|uniref:uncharacterized protein n=1 Tax=Bacidia gigantensis TaxID=2732470 RepID=UPI001D04B10D|nr:uncharacterized protein KY384_000117 [Bacidia gigantensis]KAG8526124.1 hypothetical protein KY384_000117 [Bacidia gigantensis]